MAGIVWTSCVLRASGESDQLKAFLEKSRLKPAAVFWKGEPRSEGSKRIHDVSGLNLALFNGEAETFDEAVEQTASFLEKHRDVWLLMRSLQLKNAVMDFGIGASTSLEHPWQSYQVSAQCVALAAEFGFAITLSFYGVVDD